VKKEKFSVAKQGGGGDAHTLASTPDQTLASLPLGENTTMQSFGCPIVIDFTHNQDEIGMT
jgi:hypothetical protein